MINKHIKCESGYNINLLSTNYRCIEVSPIVNKYLVYDDYNICGINYPSFNYNLGDTIKTDKEHFKIKSVKLLNTKYSSKLFLYSSEINRSSTYILPFIVNNRKDISWDKYFMNCYTGTENDKDYGQYIYIHLRYKPITECEKIENLLVSNNNFLDSRNTDKQYTLYKFSIPEKFKKDFDLILESKFSKISDEAKIKICLFHNASKESRLYKIFQKDENLRKELEEELETEIPKGLELSNLFEPKPEIFFNSYIL